MKLQHKSGRIFTYLGECRPQFSNQVFVRLLNEKTGKEERFLKATYTRYFEKI